MKIVLFIAAAAGIAAVATFGVFTSSVADPAQTDATTADPSERRTAKVGVLIKTDDYLVPAHVCADAEAERYEDCVPRSHVGENVVSAPAAE